MENSIIEDDKQEEFFLLSDASKALSELAKMKIDERFFLKLAQKNKLRLYWSLENRLVRKVEPISTLKSPHLIAYRLISPNSRAFKKLKSGMTVGQLTSMGDKSKTLVVLDDPYVTPNTLPYYRYKGVSTRTSTIKGFAALEFDDQNLIMKEWLLSQITGVPKPIISCDGVVLRRTDGLYQIVEIVNKQLGLPLDFPEVAELWITESDFDRIAKTLSDDPLERAPIHQERRVYLRIIAALLTLLSRTTRDDCLRKKIVNKEILEGLKAAPYPIEDDVITAIGNIFPSVAGLKKSNLQKKFGEAKKALKIIESWEEDE